MQDLSFVWNQYDLVRNITLSIFDRVTEETADIIPAGFSNNIRWNLGHILVCQDTFLYGPSCPHLPASYPGMFKPGTKPADWQGDVPSLATLAAQIKEQTARIKEQFASRLEEPLPQPVPLGSRGTLYTFGDAFVFSMYHEGMHIGAISALNKGIQAASIR